MRRTVENRAVLDCIGFDLLGKGELACRFAKASFNPDGTVERRGQPHRFALLPGDDIDAMIAGITPHLAVMGYSPPSSSDVDKLKAIATIIWTQEAVAEHTARWIEWERANEAHCRELGILPMTMEQGRWADFSARLGASILDWRRADENPPVMPAIMGGIH